MKKIIKSIVKVALIFIGLVMLLIALVFVDQKIAQSRANDFCAAAASNQSVQAIKLLLEQTKGTGNIVFTDEKIIVQFPQMFPEYYVCVISLNANKISIKGVVNHKD